MSSSRCTCCHVCHTSLKTSRRSFFPCSDCPSIICRQCIELTGQDWDYVNSLSEWSCPRCVGDCPCKRCRNKAISSTPKQNERKKSHKRKRANVDDTIFEDNAYPSKYKRTSTRNLSLEREKKERSTSSLLRSSSSFDYIPISECKEKRIAELCRKNEQCLDYIARTERLLTLIRSEQGRIHGELESITKLDTTTTKTIIMKNNTTTNASTSNSPECDSSEASSDIDPSSPLDEEFDTGFVHSNSANSSLESILEQHKSLVSV